jgi:hypothetical protein
VVSALIRAWKAEITGVYGTLAKRLSKKRFGEVPDPLALMWHNRPVLRWRQSDVFTDWSATFWSTPRR